MRVKRLFAFVAVMAVPGAALAAEPADYIKCDGYAGPRLHKAKLKAGEPQPPDRAWGNGGPNGVRARNFGVAGIVACEKALADVQLMPEFWLRQASLLRARALHELGEGSNEAALETLDEVDALYAAKDDANFVPGAKLTNDAIRAVALHRLKRTKEAEAMLASIDARRPYAGSVRRMTTAIRMIMDPDRDNRVTQLKAQAPLNPLVLRLLMMLAMEGQDFEMALVYADQIVFDLPRRRGGWTVDGEKERQYELITERASIAGIRSYALAALGRMDESAAELARARTEVETAIEPPTPSAQGARLSKAVLQDFDRRKSAGANATTKLNAWSDAIALRLRASKMNTAEFGKETERLGGDAMMVAPDLLGQVKASNLQEAGEISYVVERIRANTDAALSRVLSLTLESLAGLLPHSENKLNMPKMRGEGRNIWRTNLEGYRVLGADDPDLFNIRFGTLSASPARTEEAALLVAANHVASLGKDGFVIESAQTVKRSVTMYGMYYGNMGTHDSGYEVRFLVRPVDLATEAKRGTAWRMLKVSEVQAALAEVYPMMQ